MNAKIIDKNEKSYLLEVDGTWTFSIEKKRAKQIKKSVLDEVSLDIISTLIEMSKVQRSRLSRSNNPAANLLFLPTGFKNKSPLFGRGCLPITLISGGSGGDVWLGDYYPKLLNKENGLVKGAVSAAKIRHTEGVLEWFRSGSLIAMSQALGNSSKVALKHYIPQALLDVWNTRQIRRFQNLWLGVAASKLPFLLDITDFNTISELHIFLKDMLELHSPLSSPLARELHINFLDFPENKVTELELSGTLHVAINESNLSALYTYYYCLNESGLDLQSLTKKDEDSGLSPEFFLNLSQLLIQQLPSHNKPEFKQAHLAALEFASRNSKNLNWRQLFREGDTNVSR